MSLEAAMAFLEHFSRRDFYLKISTAPGMSQKCLWRQSELLGGISTKEEVEPPEGVRDVLD